MQKALRLNPYPPEFYFEALALCYFVAGQYKDSIAALQKVTRPWGTIYRHSAVNYALLGRVEQARALLPKLLEREPNASIQHYAAAMPFKRAQDLARYLDGLRKAGVPEKLPSQHSTL